MASLIKEADNLPSFGKRSVLVSREYAIPYQLGYYQQFSDRVRALIQAQYSSDSAILKNTIEKYQITHWLIEKHSFDLEYVQKNRWLKQFQPEQQTAISNLTSEQVPLILANRAACTVLETGDLMLLDTKCFLR